MFADDRAVEEQDGDIETVAALEGRVAIDVDHVDRREWEGARQRVQLPQHLVAELTVVAMDDSQT
jgi:hypothetical protein